MCDVCETLKGKKVMDNDLYYSLLKGNITGEMITKANTDDPNFKADKEMGEGKATKDELKYRQQLQDLIKQVWKIKDKPEATIKEKINELFINENSEAKELAEEFINKVYKANAEIMVAKLKKLGVEAEVPETTPEKENLIAWQKFAVEKIGHELLLGIINQRLSKNYFEASYGNKSSPASD